MKRLKELLEMTPIEFAVYKAENGFTDKEPEQDYFAKAQALQAQLDLERQQHFARWLEFNESVDVLLMKIRKLEQRLMDIEDPSRRFRRFPW